MSRRRVRAIAVPLLALGLGAARNAGAQAVPGFAGNAQHTANFQPAAQNLDRIVWQTSVDLNNTGAYAHYGAPLVTAANTVIVPVKIANNGFELQAFNGSAASGSNPAPKYTLATDYILPSHNWIPAMQPGLAITTSGTRLYYPGAGGTVYYIDNPDSTAPDAPVQQVFYTSLAGYQANAASFNSTVFINTPITADSSGDVFFGFRVQGTAPAPLSTTQSGFARIDPNGNATYVLAGAAAGDGNIAWDSHNSAPALSNDQSTLYVVAKGPSANSGASYLLGLDAATLATKYKAILKDPSNGGGALILDDGTASPTVAPDNDIYFGVFSNNGQNGSRGYLLHFSSDLSVEKTPGGFGWDYTPAIVPAAMAPFYKGSSPYLIFAKYNNYYYGDGDGVNKVALLDPNATQIDPHPSANQLVEMREVMSVIGVVSDYEYYSNNSYAVREWCINSAAVNPSTHSIFFNSEDGHNYRWSLDTNSLQQAIALTSGIGQPYVPTIIGPDGTVYALNGGNLFALGNGSGVGVAMSSSIPGMDAVVAGQSLTFTATVSNTGSSGGTPTGTVTFADTVYQVTSNGSVTVTPVTTTLASNVALSGGQASVTTSSLAVQQPGHISNHFITATYSGDGTFSGGSVTLVQRIHAGSSAVTLSSSASPSAPGQAVTFTATVTPAPSATPGDDELPAMVTFEDGANIIGQLSVGSNGTASFSTSALALGSHTITAVFASDVDSTAGSGSTTQVVQAGAPAVVSLSPASGSGASVTFTAVYSDPSGAADLTKVLLLVNTSVSAANGCYVYYQPQGNHLYLANNAGAWMTPALTPGVAGTASNSQCTLDAGSSSVSTAGNNLTLNAALSFSGTFVGLRNVYLYAAAPGGRNSGWVKEGTWTPNPTAGPPAIVSLAPNSGSGTAVTFTAVYSDPNGAADLSQALLMINTSVSTANGCYVYYQPQGNHLYLANNAGALITPALTPGVAGTASNSQCALNAGSSSVSTAGNNLTLSAALTFSSTFFGLRSVYLYAAGLSGQNSGWKKEGTWTANPSAGPPAIVSLSPNPASGASVTFTAVYSDPNGVADLSQALLLINTRTNGTNACYVYYQPQGNHLYLASNGGAWMTPALTPGVAGTASNSQCTLDAGSSSVTSSGNNLTLNVALSFSSTFTGLHNVYLEAVGFTGQTSGWVKEGTWTQ